MADGDDVIPITEVLSSDVKSIETIGRLRYNVWLEEGLLKNSDFPMKSWTDQFDESARHWVAIRKDGEIIAAARFNFLTELDDCSRDVALWKRAGQELPLPTIDFGRLVVKSQFRRRGIAQKLNEIRILAAREMNAKSIIVTATKENARRLLNLGFFDINQRIYFEERPAVEFFALQMNL
jgi:predicted GNAT family N-acyltransferase